MKTEKTLYHFLRMPALLPFLLTVLLIFFLSTLLAGCQANQKPAQLQTLRIAEQHGLAYLPLGIMQTQGLLDRELAELNRENGRVDIQWIRMGNATAIREAMLANRLDIGFMGIPPFLLGVYRETGWQLFTGLSESPLGLVTLDESKQSLADLNPTDRIALPQPGSIQHILLAMAAERQLSNPKIFDNQLVSMGHPDGLAALLTRREVTAHFTAPPFLFTALEQPGARQLISGEQAFGGPFSFIIGALSPGWTDSPAHTEALKGFRRALDHSLSLAQDMILDAQRGAVEESRATLWQEVSAFYNLEPQVLLAHLSEPGFRYSSEILGLDTFIRAMDRFGYLDSTRVTELLIQR